MSAVDIKISEALKAKAKLYELLQNLPGLNSIGLHMGDDAIRIEVQVLDESDLVHIPKWFEGHNVFTMIVGENYTGEDA